MDVRLQMLHASDGKAEIKRSVETCYRTATWHAKAGGSVH